MTLRGSGAKPSRVSSRRRRKKTRILIACEGRETERCYFDQLKRDDRVADLFAVTVKACAGGSREQIARRAVDRKKDPSSDFDEYWCVMDVEGPSHRESLAKALKLLAEHEIRPCLSNPAFEVWFLAHFEKTAQAFGDGDKAVVRLDKHWNSRFGGNYGKSDDQAYRRLSDLTQTALEHARWVREVHHEESSKTCDCNSSTEVYQLVAYLLTGKKSAPIGPSTGTP